MNNQENPDKKLFLSYSKISTFSNCPLSYKYRYIDGIPTKPSHYLSFGNSLHSAIEEFQKINDKQSRPELLVELLEKHWISEGYAENNEDEQEWKQKGINYLTNNFYAWYLEQKKNFEIEKIEERFKIENSTYILTGKVDRIDRNRKTGKYRIIDFKTGKAPGAKIVKKDLQLYIYFFSLNYFGIEPEQIESVSYFYIPDRKEVCQGLEQEILFEAQDRIEQSVKAIQTAHTRNHFPAVTSRLCAYCDYNDICPAVSPSGQSSNPEQKEKDISELVEEYLKKKKELEELEEKIMKHVRKQGGTVIEGGYRIDIFHE